MPRPPTFLRSADKLLVSSAYKALGGAAGSYQMPVRKIVFEVNAKLPSHHGLRYFVLHRMGVVELAKTYPFVEFVVKDRPNSNPLIRGFYTNGATKEISVQNKSHYHIAEKVDMILQSGGNKVRRITQPVESTSPSARGIFSTLHSEDRTRFYDGVPNKPEFRK